MSKKKDLIIVCRGGDCDGRPFNGKKDGGRRFLDALDEALKKQGLKGVGYKETGCRDHCKKGRVVALRVGDSKIHFGRINDTESLSAVVDGAAALSRGENLPESPLLRSYALDKIKRRNTDANGDDGAA